jgi:hypothetical protein
MSKDIKNITLYAICNLFHWRFLSRGTILMGYNPSRTEAAEAQSALGWRRQF